MFQSTPSRTLAIFILILAAVLEAGGDALIRAGLYNPRPTARLAFYLLAAVILFAYGWLVNAPRWEFGKLIGAYVGLFFLVAQLIAYFGFGEKPSLAVLFGGTLIVAGGLVVALAS